VDDDGIWLDMIGCRGGDDGVIGLRMKMIKNDTVLQYIFNLGSIQMGVGQEEHDGMREDDDRLRACRQWPWM